MYRTRNSLKKHIGKPGEIVKPFKATSNLDPRLFNYKPHPQFLHPRFFVYIWEPLSYICIFIKTIHRDHPHSPALLMVCKIHLQKRPGLIRHLCDLCGASVDLTVDLKGQGPNNFPGIRGRSRCWQTTPKPVRFGVFFGGGMTNFQKPVMWGF